VLAIILFFLFFMSHREPWVLEYHCEGASEDFCSNGGHAAERSFPSQQEAIDWIQGNYIYSPDALRHGDVRMACVVTYLDDDDPDPITRFRKEVDCDTQANLDKKRGTETRWSERWSGK
jgi:hypothetical protein